MTTVINGVAAGRPAEDIESATRGEVFSARRATAIAVATIQRSIQVGFIGLDGRLRHSTVGVDAVLISMPASFLTDGASTLGLRPDDVATILRRDGYLLSRTPLMPAPALAQERLPAPFIAHFEARENGLFEEASPVSHERSLRRNGVLRRERELERRRRRRNPFLQRRRQPRSSGVRRAGAGRSGRFDAARRRFVIFL